MGGLYSNSTQQFANLCASWSSSNNNTETEVGKLAILPKTSSWSVADGIDAMDQPPNHHTLYSQFRPQDYGQGIWNSGYQTQPDPNGQWQQPQPNEHIPWDATRQNPSGHWPQQPSAYTQQSIARAEDWVVNQPNTPAPPPTVPTIGSPPPKTPHSEFGTENSYPFPSTARAQAGREEKKNRIWGIKRPIFFVIVAIGIFVLVVGIATGLGVGLALGRNSNANTAGSAAVETSSTR